MPTAFEITKPKTADQLHARLTKVEKAKILAATPDGLEHLRQNAFLVDGISAKDFTALRDRLYREYQVVSAQTFF